MATPTSISERGLALSYLSRQLLLRRSEMDCTAAVRHLVGLQAQYSLSPYLALQARLRRFRIADLQARLQERRVVKSTLMRGTLHLVAAADFPVFAEIYRQDATAFWLARHPGLNGDALAADIAVFAREPRTAEELYARVTPLVPGARSRREPVHIARGLVPLVQPAPSGFWRYHGHATLTVWPEPPTMSGPAAVGHLLRAYLTAYGPATCTDAARFTGLKVTGMKSGLEFAGPLVRLAAPDGRELLDVPGAPHPDEDTQPPFRLLPKWDSALLAHQDRRRIMDDAVNRQVVNRANGDVAASYLIDGRVAGTWTATAAADKAVLTLRPVTAAAVPADAEPEADLVLGLMYPNAAKRQIAIEADADRADRGATDA